MDIKYKWYKFKCLLFGHKYSCCGDPTERCSKCGWKQNNQYNRRLNMTNEELIEAIRASQDLTPEVSAELENKIKNIDRTLITLEHIMEHDKSTWTNRDAKNEYIFKAVWNAHEILEGRR